jgi:hypothetical protein
MAVTLSISRIHPKRSSATLSDLGGQIFAFCRIDLGRGPPTIQLNHALLRWRDQFVWIVSGSFVARANVAGLSRWRFFSRVVTSDQTANKHILYDDRRPSEFYGRHGKRFSPHRRTNDGSYISIRCGAVARSWQRQKLERARQRRHRRFGFRARLMTTSVQAVKANACKVHRILSMKSKSLVVHRDFEQLPGCDECIGLAKNFLSECEMAVYNLNVSDATDQRFDFLCKYNALVRHRVSCLECNEARNKPSK